MLTFPHTFFPAGCGAPVFFAPTDQGSPPPDARVAPLAETSVVTQRTLGKQLQLFSEAVLAGTGSGSPEVRSIQELLERMVAAGDWEGLSAVQREVAFLMGVEEELQEEEEKEQ